MSCEHVQGACKPQERQKLGGTRRTVDRQRLHLNRTAAQEERDSSDIIPVTLSSTQRRISVTASNLSLNGEARFEKISPQIITQMSVNIPTPAQLETTTPRSHKELAHDWGRNLRKTPPILRVNSEEGRSLSRENQVVSVVRRCFGSESEGSPKDCDVDDVDEDVELKVVEGQQVDELRSKRTIPSRRDTDNYVRYVGSF